MVYSGIRVVSRSWLAGRWSDRMCPLSLVLSAPGCQVTAGIVRRREPGVRASEGLLYPRQIFRQRPPEIDMAGQRVHFLAVDEQLDVGDGGQVDGERVDDRIDGEQLVDGAARMRGA